MTEPVDPAAPLPQQPQEPQPPYAAPPPYAPPPPGYGPPAYPQQYPTQPADTEYSGYGGYGGYGGSSETPAPAGYSGYGGYGGYPGAPSGYAPYGAPPGYGPPGAYAPAPWGEQPPSRRRSRRMIIAVSVAAAVVVGGGVAAALVATSGGSKTVTHINAPAAIADYQHVDNATAQRAASVMRDMAGSSPEASQFFANATIAAYSANGGGRPDLIVVMLPSNGLPSGYTTGQGTVDELLSMAVQNPTSFPAGSHGGALSCGSTGFGTVQETMCAWSDKATTGLMVSVAPARQPAQVATTANSLRDEIDH